MCDNSATVGFSDGIESANVVGYAGNQLDNDYGSVLLGSQFATVGDKDGKFSLRDVVPVAGGDLTNDDLAGNISFQLLNNWGGTVEGSSRTWDGEKWILDDGSDASSDTYLAGQGLCVYNSADPEMGGVTFRSAGEVSVKDIVFQLDNDYGSVIVANGFPISVKLSDLTLEITGDLTNDDLAGNISFQKLNNWGGTVEGSSRTWDGEKWIMDDGSDASNDEIAPGEAICVYNSADPEMGNVFIRIPAPEL